MAMKATMIDPQKVFLLSGQMIDQKVGGRAGVSPVVQAHVVVADDLALAIQSLSETEPRFQVLGGASLYDYEESARRLRDVVEGRSTEWPVLTV